MFPNSHPHPDVSITVWKTWEESHYTMNMLHYTMSMRHYTMNMRHYTMNMLHYTMNMRHYSMNMLHYTMNMSRYTMNMRHEQKYKNLRNRKHFPCFHTVIETLVEVLGEREIEVGTRARRTSVFTQFLVLPNLHECFYNVWEHTGKNVFYFFYKITRIEYTVIETRILANQSSHFKNVIL